MRLFTNSLMASLLVAGLSTPHASHAQQRSPFTLAQVRSYPFPTELQAAHSTNRIVWAFNEQGVRNLWVAEAPTFNARQLTRYTRDDGQELSSVRISPDGQWLVYIRGGDFGSNVDDALPVNPSGMPIPPRTELFVVPFDGGLPQSLGEGESPVFSPTSDAIVFTRDRQLWRVALSALRASAPSTPSTQRASQGASQNASQNASQAAGAAPKRLTALRGSNTDPQFSPDGSRIAFVSSRGDHAFIGVYANDSTPIVWLAPSADRDWSPRWSPDGTRLVFARRDGSGGAPNQPFALKPSPWSLQVATVSTGDVTTVWHSDSTMRGSVPSTEGGINLHWAARDRIVFVSYADGWPHLYSVSSAGGDALRLTDGNYMVEHVSLSHSGQHVLFAANTGPSENDIDRRHVARVPVDRAQLELLSSGTGNEWSPRALMNGEVVALTASAQQPPLPALISGNDSRRLATDRVPADFPASQLVTPQSITYTSSDGVRVHAQLFLPPSGNTAQRPAVVYVHGGPSRQMLLGWHYGDYYANAYAMNQYLASRGFVVLSVNYRLGIGYGYDFYRPLGAGAQGASEYLDVKAAGEYLRSRADVDDARIGIYGGSYGGYLTALGLGRDSDLFAAGVDIHGVHDFTSDGGTRFGAGTWMYERAASDIQQLADVAWRSSPVSAVSKWKSPVLLIHGDDDRNVRFSQTVDLIQRLRAQNVPFESLIIADDTHHWMRHANQLRVNAATAEFFERMLRP